MRIIELLMNIEMPNGYEPAGKIQPRRPLKGEEYTTTEGYGVLTAAWDHPHKQIIIKKIQPEYEVKLLNRCDCSGKIDAFVSMSAFKESMRINELVIGQFLDSDSNSLKELKKLIEENQPKEK